MIIPSGILIFLFIQVQQRDILGDNKPKLNILILGDDSVGKTSLVYRHINKEYSGECQTTFGADLFTKEFILDDTLVSLQIWDTTGHDEFKCMGMSFYEAAHGCILVFDVTSRKSFENLKLWWDGFFMTNKKNPNEFPVAVVGNKIDLENERKVSKQEAQDWCNSLSIPYFECSSKDDINVQQVFEALTAKLVDTHKL
ncbi:ras-related protein Rab-7a-like [Drosophila nasuta]|uniref:ras-related protein Rab-7a-like n=1 Tax=Drosophila nasuta TaxID=42062 RepID=UPI00295E9710|nr:ras-related protein Rab-7a-like [Drosophila nasuta]